MCYLSQSASDGPRVERMEDIVVKRVKTGEDRGYKGSRGFMLSCSSSGVLASDTVTSFTMRFHLR